MQSRNVIFGKLLRKSVLTLIVLLTIDVQGAESQILKRAANAARYRVESKTENAASNATDKAIDKAMEGIKGGKGSKTSQSKKETETTEIAQPATVHEKKGTNNKSSIEIKPSTNEIFITGQVTLTGRSIKYDGYAAIQLKISGPRNYQQAHEVTMQSDGSFTAIWTAPQEVGTYYVKAVSSDKKSDTTISIEVIMLDEFDNMADENIAETEKAKSLIESKVDAAKGSLSSAQKSELETRKKKAIDNLDKMLKMFRSINSANKQLASALKGKASVPANLSANLSLLNNDLKSQADEMKKRNEEFASHKATDNTICEYLVMINEACAAFSSAVGFYSKSISTILKNIVLDKGPGVAVDAGTAKIGISPPTGTDIVPKELGKLYATSKFDAESLCSGMGMAGFAGDMMSYVSDILLKTYCGIYSGEMTQNFEFIYRNSFNDVWWKYGGTLKAVVNLRYPKSSGTGSIIKMKGSLEGNAVKFTFFADPKEAVAEEMKSSYNFTRLITLADIKPPTVPFVSAASDKAGFGAVARNAATPACFYIPIDAEYDVESGQIKIFINEALIDFTPLVKNKKVFILMGPLPLFRWEDFPIEKAQRIIRGSLKEKNWFTVTGANVGKPQFNGTITRKVSQKDFSINLDISMNVKKN